MVAIYQDYVCVLNYFALMYVAMEAREYISSSDNSYYTQLTKTTTVKDDLI